MTSKRFEHSPWRKDSRKYVKGNWSLTAQDVDASIMHKRLTVEACAAHKWQANAEATQRFYEWEIGIRSPRHVESAFAELEDREEIWHRFATTPHAAEKGYQ